MLHHAIANLHSSAKSLTEHHLHQDPLLINVVLLHLLLKPPCHWISVDAVLQPPLKTGCLKTQYMLLLPPLYSLFTPSRSLPPLSLSITPREPTFFFPLLSILHCLSLHLPLPLFIYVCLHASPSLILCAVLPYSSPRHITA